MTFPRASGRVGFAPDESGVEGGVGHRPIDIGARYVVAAKEGHLGEVKGVA